MRVEDRTGIMGAGKQIICICEDDMESQIVDILGEPGSGVEGELRLSDGYGEFYILLKPKQKRKAVKPGEKPIDLEIAWGEPEDDLHEDEDTEDEGSEDEDKTPHFGVRW